MSYEKKHKIDHSVLVKNYGSKNLITWKDVFNLNKDTL